MIHRYSRGVFAILALVALVLWALPASAQESTADDAETGASEESTTDREESGESEVPGTEGESEGSDEDEAADDEAADDEAAEDEADDEDDDGSTGAPPSNGRVTSEAGDLSGFLAPAVVSVDQQVTVHAVYQLHDHPGAGHGRPDHAGPPEGAGENDDDTESGRPGSVGPPEGVGPSFLQEEGGTDPGETDTGPDEGDDTTDEGDDTTDGETESSDDDADDGDDEPADTGELCPAPGDDSGDATSEDSSDDTSDDASDDTSDDASDDTSDEAGDGPVDEGASQEEPVEAAQAEEDEEDAEGDGEDAEDEAEEAEDGGDESDEEESEQEENEDAEEPRCLDVVFSVDYGDGTVEDMRPTKTRGADGSRRALGHHTYAAEGTYTVVITATPAEGVPVSMELTAQVGTGEARLEGEDRIATAVRVSEESFPTDGSAGAVLLARADHFADALSSATLAFVEDAPVLLTDSAELPQAVIDEIGRSLGEEGTVYLLGGEGAISATVADALTALGYEVVRLAGDDRIDTSLAIAEFLLAAGLEPTEVVVAAAGDYPDALSGAAYAAANDALVVLTDGSSLDTRVEAFLTELGTDLEVVVAGGEAAISSDVVTALEGLGFTVTRVEGEDRFDTAVAMAERGYEGGDTVVLATGADYPDALAGAVAAARRGAPVLLVGDVLPEAVAEFLAEHAETLDTLYILGGAGAVADSIIDAADELIDG